MPLLSDAIARVQPSMTVAMARKAADMKRAGRDVVSLAAGEPDFDTPAHVCAAANAAIAAGKTRYTNVDGIVELKEAVAQKFRRDNGLDVGAADCMVSAGGKQIVFNALLATLNAGDEVIVPTPYWVSYPEIVRLCNAVPVFVPTDGASGFKLTPEALARALTPRTKWLILNSPANPTGAAYAADQLRALGEVLAHHPHVHVLTDDIYEALLYDGKVFATIAQAAPALAARTLTLNGVSKSHAMTGWRIGYCTGPRPLLAAMTALQGQSTTNPSSISQWAALAALEGPQDFLAEWRRRFAARRDLVVARLNAAPGLTCPKPDGAFYAFFSVADLLGRASRGGARLDTDADFAMALLEEAGVALVPGTAFGAPGCLRLSYAASEADLEAALARIGEFCTAVQ